MFHSLLILLTFLVESGTLSLGEAGELSPNASVMLRIAALTAWAKLEIARPFQPYLNDVIQPHRQVLASLWIAALRDYATIRADIEIASQDTSMAPLDSSNSGLGRDVLLPVGESP
jgi:HEAT repeat-containing protein 5